MTTFDVVAEPTRRRILDLLLSGELAVGDLVADLAVSQPTVSRHLRVLREAGLVSSRTAAQRRGGRRNARPRARGGSLPRAGRRAVGGPARRPVGPRRCDGRRPGRGVTAHAG